MLCYKIKNENEINICNVNMYSKIKKHKNIFSECMLNYKIKDENIKIKIFIYVICKYYTECNVPK